MLLVSGAYARFDITRKALHNPLHLSYIGGHNIEHHMADAAIGIAADIVLDRRRAASQRLARGATIIGEGQGSSERKCLDMLREQAHVLHRRRLATAEKTKAKFHTTTPRDL
jgi:hypothetical protein